MSKPKDQVDSPAFETKNLRVFEVYAAPRAVGFSAPRRMFVATLREIDWPGIVATCSVFEESGNYVDWLEVIECQRRKGYATELVDGIAEFLGEALELDAVTEAGERFVEAYFATHN